MIEKYGKERRVGERWIDSATGQEVITVAGRGCGECAFSSHAGGACPGAIYDRHPCAASDRKDGKDVLFRRIRFIPEAKEPPREITLFNNKRKLI